MKKKLFLSLALCTFSAVALQAQKTTLFESDESSSLPYRIPAIVQTSNEDILVFADKRYGGGDIGQNGSNASRIDLVYKCLRNSQGTWDTNESIVKQGTNSFGYGDAAVVADRVNPKNILLMTAAGNVFFTSSTQSNPLRCYRFHSSDGGVNWDTDATTGEIGTEVTSQIYELASDYTGAFFSSGRICQSSQIRVGSHYRLYAALCVGKISGSWPFKSTKTYSIVIYSDDFGSTWYLLGTQPVIGEGGDEAKCVELPNGNVLVSSKGKSTRYFNVFKYTNNVLPTTPNTASGSWTGQVSGCTSSDANGTNGELLLVQASKKRENCYLVMQTIPANSTSGDASSRKNVTLYWKELDTTDLNDASQFAGAWSNTYSLSETNSSYSTMIQLADGSIAFAYEEDYYSISQGGYNIKYRNQSISDIASDYTLPVLDAPVISPVGGEVGEGTTVTITAANGATIYYTTDGTQPTTASTVYSGAITVNKDMIVNAIAVKKAWLNSDVATATYTLKKADPTLSLRATTTTLTVDETVQLTVETNSDGAVSYTSSNTAVATVDATGKVTAVGAGTVTITAKVAATDAYTEKSATITFTVTQPETPVTPVDPTISLTAATNTLTVGGTTQLTLTTNSDGTKSYTSSNTNVATVNANGVVTAVGAGLATITASVAATEQYNAASATVTITVNKVNATISLSAATATLTAGETTQLTATTNSDGAVTYTSSNTNVATVNANGVVTAVAAGSATITASVAATTKYTAASATCEITVNAQAAKIYTLKPLTGLIGTTTFYLVTFSATEAVSLSSGVKAYYVKETDDAGAKLTRLSGSVIPAKTGVILLAENDGEITLDVTTATGSAVTDNLLKGTLDEVNPELNSTDYILAVKGPNSTLAGKFAFCQLTDNYTVENYANRAYLSLPTTATRSITLSFDDEEGGTTAIDEVESPVDAPAEYYTLQGVKVEADQLTPGIYIMKHHGKTRKVVF